MPTQAEVNEFLDELRASGETNMYGAGPYVQDFFCISRKEASAMVREWMRTFAERQAARDGVRG